MRVYNWEIYFAETNMTPFSDHERRPKMRKENENGVVLCQKKMSSEEMKSELTRMKELGMISGTAAAALSSLRLLLAGRLRIGLSMTLPSLTLGNRQDKSRAVSRSRLHFAGACARGRLWHRTFHRSGFVCDSPIARTSLEVARMRYYLNPQFAPSIEKKGVDAVRRVPLFRSVTVSVTI